MYLIVIHIHLCMIYYMNPTSDDIPLYLWESFLAVLEEGTLQKAADKLRTTQPTITRHLHQLEESLPLNLFELRGRTKVPTSFALDLRDRIQGRLQFFPQDIRQSLQLFAQKEHVCVSVGGPMDALRRHFSTLPFAGKMQLNASDNLKRDIKDGQFDVILGYEHISSDRYFSKKLRQENSILVVPKKFLKGRNGLKDWNERGVNFPFSLHPSYRDFYDYDWRGRVSVDLEVADWLTIEKRVQAGLSWSVIPSGFVRTNAQYLKQAYPQRAEKAELYVYYRRETARQAWLKKLIEEITKHSQGWAE